MGGGNEVCVGGSEVWGEEVRCVWEEVRCVGGGSEVCGRRK